jgi:hypothetical protein
MLPSSVAKVGVQYADLQAGIVVEALALLDQALRRGRSSPDAWRDAVQSIGERMLLLQISSAAYADAYLNDVLDAQGADGSSEGRVNPQAWSDLAGGSGSWLQSLVYAPNSVRGTGLKAWSQFQFVAGTMVKTTLSDTARSSTQAAMQARPSVNWYVRMIRGKTCSRCSVLAGRKYRSNIAFRRHKRCDCIHIPAAEARNDWTMNPETYFKSLSAQEQDQVFGKGSAQAIRDSGVKQTTINQVVNADQGVETVTSFGREIEVTTVGTTKRAVFGGYEVLEDGTLRKRTDSELQKLPGDRYRTAKTPRLLPDEIYRLSEEFGWDRAETLRQLRRFAYVL